MVSAATMRALTAFFLIMTAIASSSAAPKPGSDDWICTVGVSDDNDEPCYEALAWCSKRYAKGSKRYVECRKEARRQRLKR